MHRLLQWLGQLPVAGILVLATVLALAVAVFDFYTGYELSVTLFYFLPIALVGWYAGPVSVVLIAIFCMALGSATFVLAGGHYSNLPVILWNTAQRGIFFAMFGLLLVRIHSLLRRERRLARKDPLTGLINRRGLEAEWDELMHDWVLHPHPLCLAIVDLDQFKELNDERGHAEGDEVLRTWSAQAREALRPDDTVARIGGDEFVILLPRVDRQSGIDILERLRRRVEEAFQTHGWTVGLSIGVAIHRSDIPNWSELLARADRQLYRAKQAGRGRVCAED